MTSIFNRAVIAMVLGLATVGIGRAQDWSVCDAPMNPLSADFNEHDIENALMRVSEGLSGTVTHGGQMGPCWFPPIGPITGQVAGGFALSSGSQGSIQTTFDDNLDFTYGAEFEPARPWCMATINVNGTRTAFGAGGIGSAFYPAPGRAMLEDSVVGNQSVTLQIDVIGDATRFQWTITNNDTAQDAVGLWFGGWIAILSETTGDAAGSGLTPDLPYVVMQGRIPLVEQVRINRFTDADFPDGANMYFSQAQPYGFRVENGPTAATSDQQGLASDADFVDEIVFGDPGNLIGGISGAATFNDVILPTANWGEGAIGGTTAFLQKFRVKQVLPGATTTFVHYVRTPWGLSNYSEPYAVAVDAPQVIQTDLSQPSGLANDGNLSIGVNVDNSGRPGFTDPNKIVPIQTVRVAISFPDLSNGGTNGLSLAAGETSVKSIPGSPALAPEELKALIFNVQADGINSGAMPYVVTITPSTGPVKTLTGSINISATPRDHFLAAPAANLVSIPWLFSDTSIEAVLGIPASDFQAFYWDPQQNGYVNASSVERGKSLWVIYNGSDPGILSGTSFYQSNPQAPPANSTTYPPQVRLHFGWNMIGNPTEYAFPLSQIVGVSDAANTQTLSWQELVDAGIVLNFLAYWDPLSESYKYLQDINADVQPGVGYWVYVQTIQDLTVQYPPIYAPGVGGSLGPHALAIHVTPPKQTVGNLLWSLQLAASGNSTKDVQNFIGSATDGATAHNALVRKPPLSPVGDVNLSIVQSSGAQNIPYAKSYGVGLGAQKFSVQVSTKKGGPVKVTWPNMASMPASLSATLTDSSARVSIDMRKMSSYLIVLQKGTTKTLTIDTKPITTPTIITNLANQAVGNTMTFYYKALVSSKSSAKVTTLSGQTVVQLTSNRNDPAGLRSIVWNMKDSTNRPLSPGNYLFVISSTNSAGQTDTKQLQFSR